MSIADVAMVVADTTRTYHYLDQLIKYNLLPGYILLLLNSDSELLPGQKEDSAENKLVQLLDKIKIHYDIAPNSDINSPEVVSLISIRVEQVFIFSGFGADLPVNSLFPGNMKLKLALGLLNESMKSSFLSFSLCPPRDVRNKLGK